MGTTRLQSGTDTPTSNAYKTRLPCMHVGFKRPKFPKIKNPDNKKSTNKNSNSTQQTASAIHSHSVNVVHSARKLRGVLHIKMSAIRSEHKILRKKTIREKHVIDLEFKRLELVNVGMDFVEQEVDNWTTFYSHPPGYYLDPWGAQTGQMMRLTSPNFVGDVFIRNILENMLRDLRDY